MRIWRSEDSKKFRKSEAPGREIAAGALSLRGEGFPFEARAVGLVGEGEEVVAGPVVGGGPQPVAVELNPEPSHEPNRHLRIRDEG